MKNKKRRAGKFRLIHLIVIFLVIYVAVVFNHQRKLLSNIDSKRETMEIQIEDLEKDIDALNNEIAMGGTLEFIEKVARDKLGMVKPREIIYIDVNKPREPLFDIFNKDK